MPIVTRASFAWGHVFPCVTSVFSVSAVVATVGNASPHIDLRPGRSLSELELLREVVFERELEMHVLGREPIEEVLSSTPYHLAADHDSVDGIIEEISRCIMTAMEGVGKLPLRVRNIQHRVSDRTREMLT